MGALLLLFKKKTSGYSVRGSEGVKFYLIIKMRKGTKVEIWHGRPIKPIGIGKYVRSEKWKFFNEILWIKVFKLKNKLYRGFECYWI